MSHSIVETLISIVSQSMDYQKLSMTIWCDAGVKSVEAQNAHTLTTAIQLGNLEVYFVVGAIKVWDCYETTLKYLNQLFNTSISMAAIQKKTEGVGNWRYVENPQTRYYDAAMRHLLAWFEGEKNDEETGLNHLAHAGCDILFLLWFDLTKK